VIPFQDALALLAGAARPLPVERVPLATAQGRFLAAPVVSDVDVPHFDATGMDGWAVRSAGAREGARLRALGVVAAGSTPRVAVGEGEALKVMTGAPVPSGADAVVPVEDVREDAGWVVVTRAPKTGAHVRRRGEVLRAGGEVLPRGARLTPAAVAVAAAAGAVDPLVFRRPRAALLVTGEEVVPASALPGPGQIRNSNGPLLLAALAKAGAVATDLGVARDAPAALRAVLAAALGAAPDLLLTTGGISAGDFDLVRAALEALGAKVLFHRVAIRPGKPILAAVAGATLVVGLPGNPVSTAVGFDLFVRAALRSMTGRVPPLPPPVPVTLSAEVVNRGSRLAFHPARLVPGEAGYAAEPVATRGSHDVAAHAAAGALLVLPPEGRLRSGAVVPAYLPDAETTFG
jgi:molybdopterin molybdotransferase